MTKPNDKVPDSVNAEENVNRPKFAQEFNEKLSKWSFGLYPERRGEGKESSLADTVFFGKGNDDAEKLKCKSRVWSVANKSPLIKLMFSALEASGCPIDMDRHISCEVCDNSLLGGYDPELNQIVVCHNVCTSKGRVQAALAHELVHMFDYCTNKVDFTNLDHLACAEVKAANLTSCSFFTAVSLRSKDILSIGNTHKDCVKTKAAWSIRYARNIPLDDALEVVEKVFPKCYNDLEPVGRRIRRNSTDMYKAYRERHLFGYA